MKNPPTDKPYCDTDELGRVIATHGNVSSTDPGCKYINGLPEKVEPIDNCQDVIYALQHTEECTQTVEECPTGVDCTIPKCNDPNGCVDGTPVKIPLVDCEDYFGVSICAYVFQ